MSRKVAASPYRMHGFDRERRNILERYERRVRSEVAYTPPKWLEAVRHVRPHYILAPGVRQNNYSSLQRRKWSMITQYDQMRRQYRKTYGDDGHAFHSLFSADEGEKTKCDWFVEKQIKAMRLGMSERKAFEAVSKEMGGSEKLLTANQKLANAQMELEMNAERKRAEGLNVLRQREEQRKKGVRAGRARARSGTRVDEAARERQRAVERVEEERDRVPERLRRYLEAAPLDVQDVKKKEETEKTKAEEEEGGKEPKEAQGDGGAAETAGATESTGPQPKSLWERLIKSLKGPKE